MPDRESSMAREGTLVHRALHDGPLSPSYSRLTQELRELCDEALSYEVGRLDPGRDSRDIVRESWHTLPGVTSGVIDSYIQGSRSVHVFDHKFGHGNFYPEMVWQVKGGILAVAERTTRNQKFFGYLKNHRTRQEIQVQALDKKELESWEKELRVAREKCESDIQIYNPSPDACRYCRALPKCPAASRELVKLAEAPPAVPEDPARLARLADTLELLKPLEEAVSAKVRELLNSGVRVPGRRLQKTNGKRTPKSLEEIFRMIQRDAPEHPADDLLARAKVTVGDLEEVLQVVYPEKGVRAERMAEATVPGTPYMQVRKDRSTT